MAIGRIVNAEGEVVFVQRPTTEEIIDLMMEQDAERARNLERHLLGLDAQREEV